MATDEQNSDTRIYVEECADHAIGAHKSTLLATVTLSSATIGANFLAGDCHRAAFRRRFKRVALPIALQIAICSFGAAGSLCETEYRLPHGSAKPGAGRHQRHTVRSALDGRPVNDGPITWPWVGVYAALALKERAAERSARYAELCVDAQAKFLGDHPRTWIGLFARALPTPAMVRTFRWLNSRRLSYAPMRLAWASPLSSAAARR